MGSPTVHDDQADQHSTDPHQPFVIAVDITDGDKRAAVDAFERGVTGVETTPGARGVAHIDAPAPIADPQQAVRICFDGGDRLVG